MNILSIQSHVVYGHVGNSAAIFPMQRLGVNVWSLHTVQFSNHTGYKRWKGQVFSHEIIHELITGLEELQVLPQCSGVLTGYMGSAETALEIFRAVDRLRQSVPELPYCFDPVIGDFGRGVFVDAAIPKCFLEEGFKRATILTPNFYEFSYFLQQGIRTESDLAKGLEFYFSKGIQTVLVTSVETEETPEHCLDCYASDRNQIWRIRTPKLDIAPNGGGDLISALFFVHYLRTQSIVEALKLSVNTTFQIYALTAQESSRELMLVKGQGYIEQPELLYQPLRLNI